MGTRGYCNCADPENCREPVPGCKAQIGSYLPRCPTCGYNRIDAAFWNDHWRCSNYGFFDEESRDGRAASRPSSV